jgi:hypothetical protein
MDLYPLIIDRQISEPGINPPTRVVIVHAIPIGVNGFVRMSAEDAVDAILPGERQRSRRDFRRHPQPARVEPVNQPRNGIALEIQFLQLQK